MPSQHATNFLLGLAELLDESEDAMVARATARAAIASTIAAISDNGGNAGGSSYDYDYLIVAFGESNSGGQVDNIDAASWELDERTGVNFWNVDNEVWENLNVGTNNNLDHFGLNSSQHSWELGFANLVQGNFLAGKTFAYLQTGQGGSRVTQWEESDPYWLEFVARTNATKNSARNHVIWWTLGINDIVAGVSAATFKPLAQELIGRIKTQIPGVKIFATQLMPNSTQKQDYNTIYDEIAAEDSDFVVVSSADLTLDDIHHWDYLSQKDWSKRFFYAMRSNSVVPDLSMVSWSQRSNATGSIVFTAGGQYAYINETFQKSDTFTVYARWRVGNGLVIAIDTDIAEAGWGGGADSYLAGAYAFNAALYSVVRNAGAGETAHSGVGRDLVRFSVSGNDIILATSADGGVNWSTQKTYSNVLDGVSSIRIKALTATQAASCDVWVVR